MYNTKKQQVMENKQNLQLNYPYGDNMVICKHCELNKCCPLRQQHVPQVIIHSRGGDRFLLVALCLVSENSGDGDSISAGCAKDVVLKKEEALDE